ncbi:hypothetical protein HHK36_025395 [Tetracentron sinense]|uniref:Smr domain-containing protein n=1 Tax=Tetracentron sinense TaxID=13715 RepID=A0A834YII1_TETSI|nr:hypothetical protein HHK36_025395 [Tetracentron sinense]
MNKITTLNPNAIEFIPYALKSPSGSTSTADVTARLGACGTSGKAVLDRSESAISNNSDEEAHQYWCQQLPDDITPDFKFMGEGESQGPGSLSVTGLSIHDGSETSRLAGYTGNGQILGKRQELSSHVVEGNSLIEKMRYSASSYGDNQSSAVFLNLPTNPWEKQLMNGDQHPRNGREGLPYNGDSISGFVNDMLSKHAGLGDTDINAVKLLASQFPGFAAESFAEVYYANGCDLNLTIEMLTQLELQANGGLNKNLNSKPLKAPNPSALDFPALPVPYGSNGLLKYAGDDLRQSSNPYRYSDKESMLLFKSSSSPSKNATDFVSGVRKLAPQDSGQSKYERNGSAHASVGSSRSSHILASSYSGGHGRSINGDRLQNHGTARAVPDWLETGEAVANMYPELREETHDHARLLNACFEQATQAYLIGNKALAKELSAKGQLYNMHMMAAHGKAQESIYQQRNPVGPELQGNGSGLEKLIDLHGLHVNEAIHVLKHELSVWRRAARLAEQQLQVYICVGVGHHTKGSRTLARLPVAVQRYLLEEEGLDYTEPQPGLLRVVMY